MKLSGHTLFDNTPIKITLRDDRVESIREVSTTDGNIRIAPAPIDIQVNGFAGFDLNTETVTPDDVCALVRALWRVGTAVSRVPQLSRVLSVGFPIPYVPS